MSSRSTERLAGLALSLIVACGLMRSFEAMAKGRHQPHDFSKIGCGYCHVSRAKGDDGNGRRLFRRDINLLCSSCHEDSRENRINHRVGLIPSMTVPEDLHLGPRGELTCITCHMPHLAPVDKKSGTPTFFLRRSTQAGGLCRTCHPEGKFQAPVSALRVVSPSRDARVVSPDLPLMGIVSDTAVAEVSVSTGGAVAHVPVRNRVFHTRLALRPGPNHIKVEAAKASAVSLTVTLDAAATGEDGQPPYRVHAAVTKGDCGGCHGGWKAGEVRQLDTILCNRCHEAKDKQRYRHGPVASGSCAACHDPHGQANPFLLREAGEKLCLTCHPGQMVIKHFLDKALGADPVAVRRQRCTLCHEPHQSTQKYLLRQK